MDAKRIAGLRAHLIALFAALALIVIPFAVPSFSGGASDGWSKAQAETQETGGRQYKGGAGKGGSGEVTKGKGGSQGSSGHLSTGGAPGDIGAAAEEGDEGDGPEDSDRPAWAGPGRDGKPGSGSHGKPGAAGSNRGDIYGDLWVILRDANGVPILTPEGWVQPIDAEGNLIPLDEEGAPLDETLTVEVTFSRLSVGRSPQKVLDRQLTEVIDLLNAASAVTLDAAGRLSITVDGVTSTIDSPLANLALYTTLMNTGSLPGLTASDEVLGALTSLKDGTLTVEDLKIAASFLAAAADKTTGVTVDTVVYMNTILDLNGTIVLPTGDKYVDYSTFTYDREAAYSSTMVTVLVQNPDGSWTPTTVSLYEAVFDSTPYVSSDGGVDGFAAAVDDSRAVIEFIHEYEVPTSTQ